jgi:hypothetical protein
MSAENIMDGKDSDHTPQAESFKDKFITQVGDNG